MVTMISARIVADSVSKAGVRITTFELTYPRFVHAELMTHRVFSRNSASSRAIPIKKMMRAVRTTPAYPIYWGANQKGMQAKKELTGWRLALAKLLWTSHRWSSLGHVWALEQLGLHKQNSNRLLEAHMHIKVLVTSTLWENFFQLRAHADAQPELRELANQIIEEAGTSIPDPLDFGGWHLPYIGATDRRDKFVLEPGIDGLDKLKLISAARCARISYTTFENAYSSPPQDYKLGYQLLNSYPLHASPFEHQAAPDPYNEHRHLWGNLHGWIQYRKTIAFESRMEDNYHLAHNRIPHHTGSK